MHSWIITSNGKQWINLSEIECNNYWVHSVTFKNPEGWTTEGWTWEEQDPSHLATLTSPSQVLDRIPASVYSSGTIESWLSRFLKFKQPNVAALSQLKLPFVMWIVDGSVSQLATIIFDLVANASRVEPAPNRMIKTYQNMILLLLLSFCCCSYNCCRFNTDACNGRSRSFWYVAGTSLAPFDTLWLCGQQLHLPVNHTRVWNH